MRTWGIITGFVVVLIVAGALIALVPERSEKQEPTNRTEPAGQSVPWYKRVRQRLEQRRLLLSIYLGLVALAVLALVIWLLPSLLTQHPHIPKSADRQKAITDTRTGLVALLAAIGAGGGLAYTARTYRLSREGHITDRYSKAVEQLGDEKMEVRLGGIYALERLMRDSPADQPTIMETLAAFVRQHAPLNRRPALPARGAPPSVLGHPAEDVQAVLTVLGRRHPVDNERPIDLTGTNLIGARLDGVNLTRATFIDTDFTGADLLLATLTHARFAVATLTHARLDTADVTDAFFGGATLTPGSLSRDQLARVRPIGTINWVETQPQPPRPGPS